MIRSPFPDVDIPDVPLTDFVLANAERLGDKPALIDATTDRTVTYAQLAESVRAMAAGLAERGFGKGDTFAHFAPNLPEYAIALHGVATVGGVNTTANPLLTAEELAVQLRDCGARMLVTVPALLDKAAEAAEQAGVSEIFVYGEAEGATPFASLLQSEGEPPEVAIDPASDLAALPYSSGTTGLPKGVMLTHRNLVANICQTVAALRTSRGRPRRRRAAVLPHLRARRRAEHQPPVRRDAGDDAALRAPRVPEHAAGAPDHARLCRAADRAGAGQASARGRVRPLERGVRAVRRRTAVGRPRGGVRRPSRLPDAAGVRHDGGQPRHPPGGR